MRTSLVSAALMLALFVTAARSADDADAARLARVIAPCIDDQTLAIAHLDLRAIDAAATIDRLMDIINLPEPDRTSFALMRTAGVSAVAQLKQAQARDLFIVLSVADLPHSAPFYVIPIESKTDTAAIEKVLGIPARYGEIGLLGRKFGDAFVLGRPGTISRLQEAAPALRPEITAALAAADGSTAQLLFIPSADTRRVVEEIMPTLPPEMGGGASCVFTRGAVWALAAVDLPPKNLSLRIVFQSSDTAAAAALKGELTNMLASLEKQPAVREMIPEFSRFAAVLKPHVVEDRLVLDLSEPNDGVAALSALLTPPIEAARLESARDRSINNLKQLTLAMLNYHDTHQKFPPRASLSPEGKPLLSWRVLVLPYLEGGALYREFKLDEPWDSEHNRKLIGRMPDAFRSPLSAAPAGRTTYVAPVIEGGIFGGREALALKEITDGLSNTIMIVETDADHAVIWTKPDDIEIDAVDPYRGLRNERLKGFLVGFADGSARHIPNNMEGKSLKSLFTAAYGDVIVWPH